MKQSSICLSQRSQGIGPRQGTPGEDLCGTVCLNGSPTSLFPWGKEAADICSVPDTASDSTSSDFPHETVAGKFPGRHFLHQGLRSREGEQCRVQLALQLLASQSRPEQWKSFAAGSLDSTFPPLHPKESGETQLAVRDCPRWAQVPCFAQARSLLAPSSSPGRNPAVFFSLLLLCLI